MATRKKQAKQIPSPVPAHTHDDDLWETALKLSGVIVGAAVIVFFVLLLVVALIWLKVI
jgi:hypothetical protein